MKKQITFHFLFNEKDGPVESTTIVATTIAEAEADFRRRYPLAIYHEVGVDDKDLAQAWTSC